MKLHYRCRDCEYYWKECYTMRGRRSCSYVCKNFCNKDINKTLEAIKAEIRHFMFEVNPSSSESDYACNYILDLIDKKMGKEGGAE